MKFVCLIQYKGIICDFINLSYVLTANRNGFEGGTQFSSPVFTAERALVAGPSDDFGAK